VKETSRARRLGGEADLSDRTAQRVKMTRKERTYRGGEKKVSAPSARKGAEKDQFRQGHDSCGGSKM